MTLEVYKKEVVGENIVSVLKETIETNITYEDLLRGNDFVGVYLNGEFSEEIPFDGSLEIDI